MDAKLDAKGIVPLFKDTFAEWNEDKVPRLAAAMAYYTAFSIAPLLLIAISIASIFYGNASTDARAQIAAFIPGGGDAVTGLLDSANRGGKSGIAAIIGFVTLLFGAAGLFGQLQDALNTIWEVQPKPNQGFWAMIKARFFSLTMVLGTGFLLLVSLLASSALSVVIGYFKDLLPGADIIWTILSYVVSLVLTTVVFALIFKIIPGCRYRLGRCLDRRWRHVGSVLRRAACAQSVSEQSDRCLWRVWFAAGAAAVGVLLGTNPVLRR